MTRYRLKNSRDKREGIKPLISEIEYFHLEDSDKAKYTQVEEVTEDYTLVEVVQGIDYTKWR